MHQNKVVVFVCEHGAAKSILAAALFNTLACDRNLQLTAIARGTHPVAELSAEAVSGLRADGLTPTALIPTRLEWKDLASAERVVSFCTLPEQYHQTARVEYWDDIPPVSEEYERARDAIIAHLKELLNLL